MKVAGLHRSAPIALGITLAFATVAGANAPAGRYTFSGAAGAMTVYDTKTKLTWQQTGPATTDALTAAMSYCPTVGASLGGTGWRLPTVKELLTLVDFSQPTGLLIDLNAFPGTMSVGYWSSSVYFPSGSSVFWTVNFKSGYVDPHNIPGPYAIRCVR